MESFEFSKDNLSSPNAAFKKFQEFDHKSSSEKKKDNL